MFSWSLNFYDSVFNLSLELGWVWGIAINGLRIECFFVLDKLQFPFGITFTDRYLTIKAAAVANVTRRLCTSSLGLGERHFDDDTILIIINEHSFDLLKHSGALALFP